jgi:4-amino-4-deoxy-L-arabinose transferase-like glycosyltransferase
VYYKIFNVFKVKKRARKWMLLMPVVVVYVIGMFTDVMEVDAAQYAAMAQEMTQTDSYLKIFYRGEDYIDKPPMIFWTSALSFNLFGVSNFSYKLPSLLFTMLGLFSTFRLARLYYGRWAGYFSVMILASCHAWFQFNQDVRTDAILAGCTIFAIWQLAEFMIDKKTLPLIFAGIGIAGAMMAKGPIGLMVPALAVATDLALKRDWRLMFNWKWLLVLPVVLILLTPMMIGLYQQFDATGGRNTYNGFVTSGLRFFFWTQSFGRLTGESQWQNDTSPFFFVHTFLWAFLPWCLLFIIAIGKRLKKIAFSGFIIKKRQEALTIGGIIFPFIAFSLSNYKLPHYIFVLFPLVAIVTGAFVRKLVKKYERDFTPIRIIQYVISALILALSVILCVILPLDNILVMFIALAGGGMTLYYMLHQGTQFKSLLFPSYFAIITLNFLFNAHIYPTLLKYETGNVAAQIASKSEYPLVGLRYSPYGMDFYNKSAVTQYKTAQDLKKNGGKSVWVYTDADGVRELLSDSVTVISDKKLDHFHISTLNARFLDPRTRPEATTEMHLVLIGAAK